MNRIKKQLLCLTLMVSAMHLFGADTTSKIIPRSQSFNAARQMVGWNNPEWGINRYPQDHYYSSFNLTFAYTRTFRDNRLTQALFGDDTICGPCDDLGIRIAGSAVEDRASTDWLAEYFGLPRDFQSIVSFKPTISNFILDFSFYAGLDAWVDGMYFRIHGPYVHTKWNLNAQENICEQGTIGYFQGYFSSVAVPASDLNQSFLAYANGCGVPVISNDYTSYGEEYCLTIENCTPLGTISWQSLCCSRINNDCDCGSISRNGFAELRFVLGYNFLNDRENDDYHVGLGIYAAAPTGTKIGSSGHDGQGRYLFEPIVGNGKHWELGAQVTAHHIWWRSQDDSKSLGVYLESNITHLFAASQVRCFDLLSAGSNSRYMLAQRLESNRNTIVNSVQPPLGPPANLLGLEFANEYAPVANITRRNVSTRIAVQADVAISLAYQSEGFQWDVGYNFWGRTCEDICIDDCCPGDNGFWTVKGDQRVYGFRPGVPTTDLSFAVAVATSDSQATINQGANMANGVSYLGTNPTAPRNAYADDATDSSNVFILPLTIDAAASLFVTPRPIAIQESDFNLTGTRGTSNKVFTNFNWAWADRDGSKWTPYLGLGAEVEFGTGRDSCMSSCKDDQECAPCYTPCATTTGCDIVRDCSDLPRRAAAPGCVDVALSQWGIWFKVGASYN